MKNKLTNILPHPDHTLRALIHYTYVPCSLTFYLYTSAIWMLVVSPAACNSTSSRIRTIGPWTSSDLYLLQLILTPESSTSDWVRARKEKHEKPQKMRRSSGRKICIHQCIDNGGCGFAAWVWKRGGFSYHRSRAHRAPPTIFLREDFASCITPCRTYRAGRIKFLLIVVVNIVIVGGIVYG